MERQLTIAYSRQQNSVAKRMNRTNGEMSRSMMVEKMIPIVFLTEAIANAVYLQNRSFNTAVKDKTLFEAFTCRTPDIKHLKV